MKYYLFIGGPWNGDLRQANGQAYWNVPIRRNLSIKELEREKEEGKPLIFTYRLCDLRLNGKLICFVYAEENLSDQQIIEKFLTPYQNQP